MHEFSIKPMFAPQRLSLSIIIDEKSSSAYLKPRTPTEGMKFVWEKWINAAMTVMKCHKQKVKNKMEAEGRHVESGPLELIKNVDS